MALVSRCCKKEIFAVHADEGTGYYQCRECNKPCDPLLINIYTPLKYAPETKSKGDENG